MLIYTDEGVTMFYMNQITLGRVLTVQYEWCYTRSRCDGAALRKEWRY